jgi:hypothetical protein
MKKQKIFIRELINIHRAGAVRFVKTSKLGYWPILAAACNSNGNQQDLQVRPPRATSRQFMLIKDYIPVQSHSLLYKILMYG